MKTSGELIEHMSSHITTTLTHWPLPWRPSVRWMNAVGADLPTGNWSSRPVESLVPWTDLEPEHLAIPGLFEIPEHQQVRSAAQTLSVLPECRALIVLTVLIVRSRAESVDMFVR